MLLEDNGIYHIHLNLSERIITTIEYNLFNALKVQYLFNAVLFFALFLRNALYISNFHGS